MKTLTFQEVVAALEGQIDRPMPFGSVARVSIDSRKIRPGDLFVAIRGERFDGHLFVGEAFEAGAMAAVVRNDYEPATPAHNGKRAGDGSANTILALTRREPFGFEVKPYKPQNILESLAEAFHKQAGN